MAVSSLSAIQLPPQWQAFLRRWLNLHRVLWALTLAVFFIAWNRGLALLSGLFSILLALLLLSYFLPRRQLRQVLATRKPIGDLTAGQPGRIDYVVEAGGRRYHVELFELMEFADQKEQYYFFDTIAGPSNCRLQFKCRQRGCFWLSEIRLSSAYPFGIVRAAKWIFTEPEEVLIFPEVVSFSSMPMPLVAETTTRGDVSIPQKGGRDEFVAVREYCHGDELNRIHWPVSARHQNFVVKEYEKIDRPAMLVVLDGRKNFNVGEGRRSTFEFAVTIAASLIRFASDHGMPCFLVTQQDRLQTLAIDPYRQDLRPLFESLARLSSDSSHPYHPIVEQAHRRYPQANLVVTFRLASDVTQPRLSRQVTQIVLEMDDQSFRSSKPTSSHNEPRQEGNRLIYSVHADSELVDIFQ